MSPYQDSINQKRAEATEKQEKQASIDAIQDLSKSIKTLLDSLETTGVKKLDKEYIQSVKRLETVLSAISTVKITSDQDIKGALRALAVALNNLDVKPTVNVAPAKVTVNERKIDFSPVIKALDKIKQSAPVVNVDIGTLDESIKDVKKAISGLTFPTANFILPFKDPSTGKATQVTLSSDGKLPVEATIDTAGLATATKQDTIIGHLDGVEGLLTTIDADTGTLAATDFATEAKQDDIITAIGAIPGGGGTQYTEGDTDASFTGTISLVEGAANTAVTLKQPTQPTDTQPISATSLPLPTGAATAANQQTDALTDTELRATPVPVSGTVTANLSATDNQVLDDIKVDTEAIETAVEAIQAAQLPDGHNVTVDNASLAVTNAGLTELAAAVNASSQVDVNIAAGNITGFATSAKQDTIIGHLDGVEGLLTTIDTDTGNIATSVANIDTDTSTIITNTGNTVTELQDVETDIEAGNTSRGTTTDAAATAGSTGSVQAKLRLMTSQLDSVKTAVETIDNAISGSEMQVDVVAALPAGTNAIGKTGHDISGIGHGVTTVTTAGTDVALAASTACKEVTIQAQTDNTSSVAVGATGVDATVATGTGILLGAGDSITLKCDNLADIYIDSLVNGEGVRYVYLT